MAISKVKEHVEYLELKPYKCYHCEGLIGLSSRSKLYVGATRFIKSVTMECGYCGKHTYWKPDNESLTKK